MNCEKNVAWYNSTTLSGIIVLHYQLIFTELLLEFEDKGETCLGKLDQILDMP